MLKWKIAKEIIRAAVVLSCTCVYTCMCICWQSSRSRTDRKSATIRADVTKSEILNSTNKSHPDLCSTPEKYFRTALWVREGAPIHPSTHPPTHSPTKHTHARASTHFRESVLFFKRDRADVVIESSGRTRAMVHWYRGGGACSAGINSVVPWISSSYLGVTNIEAHNTNSLRFR